VIKVPGKLLIMKKLKKMGGTKNVQNDINSFMYHPLTLKITYVIKKNEEKPFFEF
jgi:hypothetical protein